MLPVLFVAALAPAGCDIIHGLGARESAEWHKTYTTSASPTVEIDDINGKINVDTSSGNTVEVSAVKTAHGASPDAAKANLERITLVETATASAVKIETTCRPAPASSPAMPKSIITVKVPAGASVKFVTINGTVEIDGVQGAVVAETTNGKVHAAHISGAIDASTTNGGVDVAVTAGRGRRRQVVVHEWRRLARAAARRQGDGVGGSGQRRDRADNLSIDTTESSRRHLEGRMNGGGPRVHLETTNGGITISGR